MIDAGRDDPFNPWIKIYIVISMPIGNPHVTHFNQYTEGHQIQYTGYIYERETIDDNAVVEKW